MRIRQAFGLIATMRQAGLIAPFATGPLRIVAAMRRETIYGGVRRCCDPTRPAIDELGTGRQLDERGNALAAALQAQPAGPQGRRHHVPQSSRLRRCAVGGQPDPARICCSTHSFAGPALAGWLPAKASTMGT